MRLEESISQIMTFSLILYSYHCNQSVISGKSLFADVLQ